MKLTNFASSSRQSPLSQTQTIGHGGALPSQKRTIAEALLPLTSLIDAFCIIVIYLLIGTETSGLENDLKGQLKLPKAQAGEVVSTTLPTVRIEKGQYFINDNLVTLAQLPNKLAELKTENEQTGVEILIQADQNMDYAELDPILRAGSAAGIQKLKFAVMPTK